MAACLLMQIFSCASLANAYEEFGLIDGATPACKDCAANNNAPVFSQTRVAMQDAYGQAPAMVGSDPVVEAPPAVGETAPVAVEPIQQPQDAFQVVEQQVFEDQQFVESPYPQSGGLGEAALEYPTQSWPLDYPSTDDYSMNYGQPEFEQLEFDQGFNSGVEQVSYESEYPMQDFGQAIVSHMPMEQYPSDQTYSSYQAMPSVTQQMQQQNYNSTYTSSPSSSGNVQPGLAQQKAVQAAQSGIQGHLGGGLGGAKYEGVGWSNHSAQNAINSCCYWGVRTPAQIGVSKGNDGFWYACVLYH